MPQPYLEKTQLMLDQFSIVGLRTLVFACRVLTEKQFKSVMKLYQDAMISAEKKKLLNQLSDQLDQELILLGCSAIEDNLQEQVPESIQRFYEANIKVWMITGDKFETAENIGHCAGIIRPNSQIFRFKNPNIKEFAKQVREMKRDIQSMKSDLPKAIIIDTTKASKSKHLIFRLHLPKRKVHGRRTSTACQDIQRIVNGCRYCCMLESDSNLQGQVGAAGEEQRQGSACDWRRSERREHANRSKRGRGVARRGRHAGSSGSRLCNRELQVSLEAGARAWPLAPHSHGEVHPVLLLQELPLHPASVHLRLLQLLFGFSPLRRKVSLAE